jgi:HK97 family phage portal protein
MMQFLKRMFGFYENPAVPLTAPDENFIATFGGGSTTAGITVNHSTAIAYPPLWRAVNLVSGDVAKIPFDLYRRKKNNSRELATKHPAYKLVRRKSNKWITAYSFKKLLTYHALWYGNGYALIVRNGGGMVENLVPLDPASMSIMQADGELWYIPQGMRNSDGKQVRYRAEDVFHLKGLSHDGLIGYDVISVMRHQLGLGMAAQEFGARYFSNGASMGGVLMVPGRFDEDKARNILQMWNEMATGVAKSHKVGVLQDGVEYKQITSTMEQSQFTETRQFEVRSVANIMGVPPHKLGDDTRTAFASLEQENQSYLQECLDQWLCAWEDEAYDKLLGETEKRLDSHFFEFNRKALIRTDISTENQVMIEQLNNGVLSLNDVLAIQNKPPVEGGDKRRIPLNMGMLDEEGNIINPNQEMTPDEPPDDAQEAEETPDDTNTEEMEQALENLLRDRVERMVNIERNKVKQLAKRGGNFLSALDEFYQQHESKMIETLTPVITAIDVHFKTSTPIENEVKQHCTSLVSGLVEMSGGFTDTAEMVDAIEEYYIAEHSEPEMVKRIMKGREIEQV